MDIHGWPPSFDERFFASPAFLRSTYIHVGLLVFVLVLDRLPQSMIVASEAVRLTAALLPSDVRVDADTHYVVHAQERYRVPSSYVSWEPSGQELDTHNMVLPLARCCDDASPQIGPVPVHVRYSTMYYSSKPAASFLHDVVAYLTLLPQLHVAFLDNV